MFDTGSTIYLNDSSDADNLPKMSDTAFLLEVLEYENVLERTHAETQVLPAPLDSTQSGLFARITIRPVLAPDTDSNLRIVVSPKVRATPKATPKTRFFNSVLSEALVTGLLWGACVGVAATTLFFLLLVK
jgi:hypothetical protein